jgi:hypothetical protein
MFNVKPEIYKKYKVTDKNRSRIELLKSYDLDFLSNTFNDDLIRAGRPYSVEQVYPIIVRFGKCDFELAKKLEVEFRKFVALTLITPGVPHAPPGAVDMYWHFFILHTERYTEFCERLWGGFRGDQKYRHHYPATDETRAGMLRAYLNTRELYVEVFGEPELYQREGALPVHIWTARSHTSGDSYSGVVDPSDKLTAAMLAAPDAD